MLPAARGFRQRDGSRCGLGNALGLGARPRRRRCGDCRLARTFSSRRAFGLRRQAAQAQMTRSAWRSAPAMAARCRSPTSLFAVGRLGGGPLLGFQRRCWQPRPRRPCRRALRRRRLSRCPEYDRRRAGAVRLGQDDSGALASKVDGNGWMIGPYFRRGSTTTSISIFALPGAALPTISPRWDDGRFRYLPLAGQRCARRQLGLWGLAFYAVGRARLRDRERRRLYQLCRHLVPGQDVSLGRLQFGPEVGYRFAHTPTRSSSRSRPSRACGTSTIRMLPSSTDKYDRPWRCLGQAAGRSQGRDNERLGYVRGLDVVGWLRRV